MASPVKVSKQFEEVALRLYAKKFPIDTLIATKTGPARVCGYIAIDGVPHLQCSSRQNGSVVTFTVVAKDAKRHG
jgi:hypothetical protein